MTKFEEEFKALTSWDWVNADLIQQILTRFGNWHSDEEFQAKEKEIKRLRKINHLYKKAKGNAERMAVNNGERLNQAQDEIASLKSQLQQQALPVVPDFIGKLINTFGAPEDGKYINYSASYLEIQKELDWIDNHQKTWLTALLIGFRVEKPQLFYLKNKLTGMWLMRDEVDKVYPYDHTLDIRNIDKFTQQEIDSMDTGSYELVPVEDGE
ncbi:hypothetical protein LLCRE1631_02208 [Lactococcus lactis subsp. lactis CNCM I-1631]|uniref:DUF1642 domain-containing protein n=1 Tax=Lactococcus lactis TaxID=1358 RepID=UPI000230ED68|nr:DUF1642 domain-containing protein [Lactococcus lactis]EHE92330.1 hypothetical protein LLCRE1631_02208 [Lactococcus lactis subsp. lactis CNCM I-1631]